MKRIATALAALTAGATLAAVPLLAAADDIETGSGAAVTGIAWDPEAEVLFVASRDEPDTLAMFDETGEAVGELTFSGAPAAVESLQWHDGMLYIADVGDPGLARESVTVFAVLPEEGEQSFQAWDFRFADGPQDVEAFMISGRGRFYFVTGGDDPGVYASELNPSRQTVNDLHRAQDAPPAVTDGVFLDDGATMLLRTGAGMELIDAFSWDTLAATTYVGGGADESVTLYGDGRVLVGSAGVFRDEPLPDGFTTMTPSPVPDAATALPSDSGAGDVTPTATDEAVKESEDGTSEGTSRSGTVVALLVAIVVSIGAGAVAYFWRS